MMLQIEDELLPLYQIYWELKVIDCTNGDWLLFSPSRCRYKYAKLKYHMHLIVPRLLNKLFNAQLFDLKDTTNLIWSINAVKYQPQRKKTVESPKVKIGGY